MAFLELLEAGNKRRTKDKPTSQVIAIGSVGGLTRFTDSFIYNASKAAVHHLMKNLGAVLVPHDIRTNVIAPGCECRTGLGNSSTASGKELTIRLSRVPIGHERARCQAVREDTGRHAARFGATATHGQRGRAGWDSLVPRLQSWRLLQWQYHGYRRRIFGESRRNVLGYSVCIRRPQRDSHTSAEWENGSNKSQAIERVEQ